MSLEKRYIVNIIDDLARIKKTLLMLQEELQQIQQERKERQIVKYELDAGAHPPERAHDLDAGWDLRCIDGATVEPGGGVVFDTGVHVELPAGYAGMVKSKSGLYVNYELTSTGVVDVGFSGSIKARVTNHSKENAYTFEAGDKITQLVIIPIADVEFVQVDKVAGGERGDSGYGSTGR